VETYLNFFRWEEKKYPSTTPLKTLVDQIHTSVAKLDEELKAKGSEYSNLVHALLGEERRSTGNLLMKDLSEVVQKKHTIPESEFLETVFVCVPKSLSKTWNSEYEKLSQWVVPRSSEMIAEDSDYQLYRVVVFSRFADEYKHAARDKKFVIREFVYDPNKNIKEERKKMEGDREKLKMNLIRWCKSCFSEAFSAWIHVKAIRTFVESVLRYGLPTNFQAMLLLPHKNKVTQLRKVLTDLYSHLTSKNVFGGKGEELEVEEEKFYPYVSLEVNLDFRKIVL